MATSTDDRLRIERLEELLASLQASGQQLQASGNYWAMNNAVPNSQTATAAGATCLAAIALIPQYTGLFEVHASVSYSSSLTAIAHQWTCLSDTSVGGALSATANFVTNGWAGRNAQPTWDASINAGVPSGRVLNVDAAGTAASGILYNGAAFTTAPKIQKVQSAVTLTGLLTASVGAGDGAGQQQFEAHGIMGNTVATGAKTPFTVAAPASIQTVAFGLLLSTITTAGGSVFTIQSLDFYVRELQVV